MAKAEKTPNYTDEQEARLVAGYNPDATQAERNAQVDALGLEMGKKPASIRAKLTSMKRYVKQEYQTKTGEKPVRKADIVDRIADGMGFSADTFDSLGKATMPVLAKILEFVNTANESNFEEVDES